MPKLTATTPHGTFTRRTDRAYTHVVNYGGERTSWHGSLALAEKKIAADISHSVTSWKSIKKDRTSGKFAHTWVDEQGIDVDAEIAKAEAKTVASEAAIYPVDGTVTP